MSLLLEWSFTRVESFMTLTPCRSKFNAIIGNFNFEIAKKIGTGHLFYLLKKIIASLKKMALALNFVINLQTLISNVSAPLNLTP